MGFLLPRKIYMKKILIAAILFFATEGMAMQMYDLPPFKSIVLNGNATVELVNGPYATDDDKTIVKNQVLFITFKASKISAPRLKNITVANNSVVNAKNFKTSNLTITAKGNGTVNLEGKYNINKIYQYGSGRINIDWIDSDNLFIDSNSKGPIYLAGKVNSMVAKLTHNAMFDARYLRTKKASIFTTDTARAYIAVLDTLGAFAVDNSNIYYYKRPHKITVVTKGSGNVLHPDWIK